jgi:hypothetical protein
MIIFVMFIITVIIIVRYHVDRCTKNKRMFRILICGLFLTCTECLLFIKHKQILIIMIPRVHVMYCIRKKTLTLKGGPLFMVVNPHPSQSLA